MTTIYVLKDKCPITHEDAHDCISCFHCRYYNYAQDIASCDYIYGIK